MEIWKKIKNYNYSVSTLGKVRNDKKNKLLKGSPASNGYPRVTLYSNGTSYPIFIHRLVAIAFLKKRKGKYIVNHLDNNPTNNKVENLEWTDFKGNSIHAYQNGYANNDWNRRAIIAIKQDGTQILFQSITQAEKVLAIHNIGAVARGVRKSVGGYTFKYLSL